MTSSSAKTTALPWETLVERTTRYMLLLHRPDGSEADKVSEAMKGAITTLPEKLRRT